MVGRAQPTFARVSFWIPAFVGSIMVGIVGKSKDISIKSAGS
jgi:hypothetical protein